MKKVGRKPGTQTDHERDAKIVEAWISGKSSRDIGLMFRLSSSRVSQILIRHRGRVHEFEFVAKPEADQIVRMVEQGIYVSEIARQTGRSKTTIRRVLKQRGVAAISGIDTVGPEARRKAVDLVLNGGLSYGQVALRLGIRRGVVAGAVSRARKSAGASP